MADKSLIRGAALIGASKRSTWGEAMQEGLAQGFAAARIASQNRKAEKAAINSKVAGYIDSLNSNVDLTSLSASQQQAVANYLTEEKMRYADAATRIAKIDPDNPEYMELRDEMNGVKMSFQNLANNLNQYKQDKQAYLEDFDKGLLSDGNEISSLKDASDIYTDGGYAGVGKGGSLVFWDDNSKEYKNYSEMQKPFLKDFSAADKIIQLNESVYNAGSVLSGARENMIRQKLNNMISQGGRQTLLSLASDDFILEGGLGLQDPSLFDVGNEEALKAAVIDGYMNTLKDSARQGAIDKRPSSGKGRGGFSGALQDEINLSGPVINDAMRFSMLSANVPASQRGEKTQILVNMLNNIDPTAGKPSYISRQDFYNEYLSAMDIKDSKEARNKFVKDYGNNQIYKIATNLGDSYGITINTDNPRDLYKLYIQNSGLSSKAENYHLGQYENYLQSITGNDKSSDKSSSGSMAKYNK